MLLSPEQIVFLVRVQYQWKHICDIVALQRQDANLDHFYQNIWVPARHIVHAMNVLLSNVCSQTSPLPLEQRSIAVNVMVDIYTQGNLHVIDEMSVHTPWGAMLAVNQYTSTPVFDVHSLSRELQIVCDDIIPKSILGWKPELHDIDG